MPTVCRQRELRDSSPNEGNFQPSSDVASNAAGQAALITAALVLVFASAFDLTAIASLGSAVALAVFLMVTVSHYRRKEDTGAKGWILILAGLATLVTLVLLRFIPWTKSLRPSWP